MNTILTILIALKLLTPLDVTATAYTSSPAETDSTPHITASGHHLSPGDRVIAVSRDLEARGLTFGSLIFIPSLGWYTVEDRMHRRWRRRIDIWMESRRQARIFGKKHLRIYVLRAATTEKVATLQLSPSTQNHER